MTADTGSLQRQRRDLATPPLAVEVDHGTGTVVFVGEERVAALHDTPAAVAAWTPIPDLTSLLSAEPAVLYRCGDLAIPLTPTEYAALVGGDLRAAEVAKLRLVFGPAWEWGETFYAPETFAPQQPRSLREQVRRLREADGVGS